MISASADMITHLAQRTTTLALLWLVTRADGQVFAFTSHDADIEVSGVTYVASYGFSPSALQSGAGLAVGNAEVSAVFNGSAITEADLRAGLWDHADVRVRAVNWADTSQGVLKLLRGWLGEVSFDGFRYRAELRGVADLVNRSTGEIVTPGCSAAFGDARCGADVSDHTYPGEVTAVTSNRLFDTDLAANSDGATADYFQGGILTWVTGANAGRSMEVKTNAADGEVTLHLPMEGTVAPGDTFTVVAGCDKSKATCIAKFDNVLNFRGFPDLPGIDQVLRIGGQ